MIKIVNIGRQNFHIFNEELRNFNEIFRKDVNYDNFKSHKKAVLCLLSRRYVFWKTIGGGEINLPQPF